jgi:MFS family permease
MAQAAKHVPAQGRAILGPAYWRVWWANTGSGIGDGVVATALPLLAVTITRDPVLVALVSAAFYLPWLLLSLPAGAVVDRYDRVALMWRAQAVQAAMVALIAVLVAIGAASIAALVAAGFCMGAAEVIFSNASQAELPRLVPAARLSKANGNLQVSLTLGQTFLGPPLGSTLFAAARALPFGLGAGSFVASAAVLSGLPRREPAERQRLSMAGLRGSVMEGLRWLLRHRLLRVVAVLLGAANFGSQMGQATLVLLATETLHIGTRGYGLLFTAAAVGSIVGGLTNPAITRRAGELPSLIIAMASFAAVYVAIGLAPGPIVLGLLMACNGFFVTMWNVVTVSMRQRIVPDELLGRVNSVYRMIGWGLIPLGSLAGGFAASLGGLRAPYVAGGVVCGLALLVALPALLRARRSPAVTVAS